MRLTVANEMRVIMTYTILNRCFTITWSANFLSPGPQGTVSATWMKITQSRATADPSGICYLSEKKNFSQKMVKIFSRKMAKTSVFSSAPKLSLSISSLAGVGQKLMQLFRGDSKKLWVGIQWSSRYLIAHCLCSQHHTVPDT